MLSNLTKFGLRSISKTTTRSFCTRFSKDHEWVRLDSPNIASFGITDHAQNELGEIVFCDLPSKGQTIEAETAAASVESVKAVSEVFAPIGGKVIEVNEELTSTPELINSEPQGKGWIFRMEIENTESFNKLMDKDSYEKFCKEEHH